MRTTSRVKGGVATGLLFVVLFCGMYCFAADSGQTKPDPGTASQPAAGAPELDMSALEGEPSGSAARASDVPTGATPPAASPAAVPEATTPAQNTPAKANATAETPAAETPANGNAAAETPAADTPAKGNATAETPVQDSPAAGTPATASGKTGSQTLWQLVLAGGWVGVCIFILSLVACSLVIQFCFSLRRSEVVPVDIYRETSRLIETGYIRQAMQPCQDGASPFARVASTGLAYFENGWPEMERHMEDAISEEVSAMYRRVEYLSVIGNIAPMLGLLGTVLGMVTAFGQLSVSDGSGRDLAQGIYFALVTTVDGLLVAIPALLAFALFNSRVANLASELSHSVESAFRPLNRGAASGPGPIPASPVPRPQFMPTKTPPRHNP